MKRKLRIIALVMFLVAIVFVIFAIATMDVPIVIPIPLGVRKVIFKIYPWITIGIFILSFFVKDKNFKDNG